MDKKKTIQQIKDRILAEHRKHSGIQYAMHNSDWANIAAHKIWSEHLNKPCEHPFHRLHWVDDTVFCNKCKTTLTKKDK